MHHNSPQAGIDNIHIKVFSKLSGKINHLDHWHTGTLSYIKHHNSTQAEIDHIHTLSINNIFMTISIRITAPSPAPISGAYRRAISISKDQDMVCDMIAIVQWYQFSSKKGP